MKRIFYNSKVYLNYIPRQQIYYLVSTLNNKCTWNNYRQTCERCCCNIICPFLQLHLIQSIFVHPIHSICIMTSFRSVATTTCVLDYYVHTTLKFLTSKWPPLTSLGVIKITSFVAFPCRCYISNLVKIETLVFEKTMLKEEERRTIHSSFQSIN